MSTNHRVLVVVEEGRSEKGLPLAEYLVAGDPRVGPRLVVEGRRRRRRAAGEAPAEDEALRRRRRSAPLPQHSAEEHGVADQWDQGLSLRSCLRGVERERARERSGGES